MSTSSSPTTKQKRSGTLQKLFKRGIKGEPQSVVVFLDDKNIGKVDYDLANSLAKFRAYLAAATSLPLPDNFSFSKAGNLIALQTEDKTNLCDSVVAENENIVIKVVTMADTENKVEATSPRAGGGGGRGMLKRTKPKGGAMQDMVRLATQSEAEALAIDLVISDRGGVDNLSVAALKEIAGHCKSMSLDATKDDEVEGMFKVPGVLDAARALSASIKDSLSTGKAANDGKLHGVAHDDKGTRPYMEDKWILAPCLGAMFGIDEEEPTYFYGVYDGHTGKLAAEYVRTHLHANVARHPLFSTDLRRAITEAYLQTDEEFNVHAARQGLKDGTTSVTIVIRGNMLYSHWAGDSEALLCHRSRSLKLVDAHTPARADEKERIAAAGGTVVWFGTWRVNGQLGVARSLGDADHKGVVVATPDSIEREITADDSFIMLATDGLFDVFKHEEATMSTIHWINSPERNPDEICKALVGESLRRKTKDNVTCMFVFFKENSLPKLRPQRTAHPKVPTLECPLPPREAYEAAKAAAGQ